MSTAPRLPATDVAALKRQLQGRVVLPGDEAYDRLRTPWLQVVDQHPALIVEAGSTRTSPRPSPSRARAACPSP